MGLKEKYLERISKHESALESAKQKENEKKRRHGLYQLKINAYMEILADDFKDDKISYTLVPDYDLQCYKAIFLRGGRSVEVYFTVNKDTHELMWRANSDFIKLREWGSHGVEDLGMLIFKAIVH